MNHLTKINSQRAITKQRPDAEAVVLLCDTSSSMTAHFKSMSRVEAVSKAVEKILEVSSPKRTSYALYTYNDYVECMAARTNIYSRIHAANNFQPTGCTRMGGALSDVLRNEPGIHRIILLSDGQPTDGSYALDSAVERAIELHVKIDTIAIGDSDSTLMRSIAERTGGKFSTANDPEALAGVYQQLETRNYLRLMHVA